jgi:hypothetical protein
LKYIVRFSTLFIFWSDWIRSVQNGSNLIKLDFWWNNYWNISSDFQLYSFFDQIESDLSKMDQNGSNFKIIYLMKYSLKSSDFQLYLFFDQIKSAPSRMDQNRSNLIKLNIWLNNHWNISSDFQLYFFLIRLNQICPKWIKLDQIGFLINDQRNISSDFFFYLLMRLNQICPKWIKIVKFAIFINFISFIQFS